MSRGIYILANDRVIENSIALLNSIRLHDPDTPIVMIPYNDQYQQIAELTGSRYGVQVYDNLEFIEYQTNLLNQICGQDFFDRPNLLRKLACWFGPFDEFLYIDTDIVVFEKVVDTLDELANYDFLCCDYQYLAGIKQVFSPPITKIFNEKELQEVFNTGFWASRKGLVSEKDVQDMFAVFAANPECFYLLNSDQTFLNYMVLKYMPRRLNLLRKPGKWPGNWAGSKHFQIEGNRVIDPNVNQPLKFLHWAGVRIAPGGPYWEIWEHYRYLNEPKPPAGSQPQTSKSLWQRIVDKIRS